MSETDRKSTRRKERGLNVRVVQEQKEKKTDKVRVNTREKKSSSKKKDTEVEIVIDTNKANPPEEKVEEEITWKEEKKTEEKVEEKIEEKPEEKIEEVKEEAEEKVGEVEEKAEEEPEETSNEPADQFETLNLHTDTNKTTSKVIPRDVAKETPITDSIIAKETPKPKPKDKPAAFSPAKKSEPAKKFAAKELKEQEIKKAVSMATRLPQPSKKVSRRSRVSKNFGVARVALAIACLSTAVFAIVYFVNLNSSDISLRVAAMQSGIEAVYPSYTPRGYTLADVTSASGKVTMKFKSDNGGYTIIEEQTDWNSDGLLSNFVKPNYGDEYTVVSEQGLTLYVGDRWAAWVNGGMVYKLAVDSGNLTKKQIKAIAVSL